MCPFDRAMFPVRGLNGVWNAHLIDYSVIRWCQVKKEFPVGLHGKTLCSLVEEPGPSGSTPASGAVHASHQ